MRRGYIAGAMMIHVVCKGCKMRPSSDIWRRTSTKNDSFRSGIWDFSCGSSHCYKSPASNELVSVAQLLKWVGLHAGALFCAEITGLFWCISCTVVVNELYCVSFSSSRSPGLVLYLLYVVSDVDLLILWTCCVGWFQCLRMTSWLAEIRLHVGRTAEDGLCYDKTDKRCARLRLQMILLVFSRLDSWQSCLINSLRSLCCMCGEGT